MAKSSPSFALTLAPRDAHTPAQRWLCSALRAEILGGRLRAGARLPATRQLAQAYGLARGTIVRAFEQLKAEGYVRGSVGSGTYVNKLLPDELLQVPRTASESQRLTNKPWRRLSGFSRRVRPFPAIAHAGTRAFRANQPAVDLFPASLWAQVAARRFRRASVSSLIGCGAMGYRPLQEAVADYLTTSRGVRCVAEQVAIVSGVQEALDIVARLLLNPGERVCMESPGYVGARLVFEALGAKVIGLPLDEEGMLVPGSRRRGVRLAYVTPAHQFPLGVSMSLARRLALLEWAQATHATIFEDDYDSEFRYAGKPLPALQGLDRHGVVLFAGSFSKVLFPSLRLGYLVLPEDLVDRVAATKSVTSRHAPVLEQAVLADFMAEGHFGRHVRRMREVYAERLMVLLECARERLTGLLEISGVEAGLQTVGWLARGIDGEGAAAAAAKRNVEVMPLSRYGREQMAREGLQIGFAAVDAYEIRRGVGELASTLDRMVPNEAR